MRNRVEFRDSGLLTLEQLRLNGKMRITNGQNIQLESASCIL